MFLTRLEEANADITEPSADVKGATVEYGEPATLTCRIIGTSKTLPLGWTTEGPEQSGTATGQPRGLELGPAGGSSSR